MLIENKEYVYVQDSDTGEDILFPTHSKSELLKILYERFDVEVLKYNTVINLGVPEQFDYSEDLLEEDKKYYLTKDPEMGMSPASLIINLVLE